MMKLNGIQAGHCIITPTCRENRGQDGAWVEACARLRKQYDEICDQRPDIDQCDFHLALVLETPRHKAAAEAA